MPTSILSSTTDFQVPTGVAPNEAPKPTPEQPDPCNRDLDKQSPEVVNALRGIIEDIKRQNIVARRWQIRRIRKSELYWQGIQYLWWNPVDQNFHLPTEANIFEDSAIEEGLRYQFVTNIYQAYGLSFIAVVSQDVPNIHFFPEDPNDEEDIQTARAASDVAELIQRNNDPAKIFSEMGYYAYTGGILGMFVRYVADGDRFGWDTIDQFEPSSAVMGEDTFICPNCKEQIPTNDPSAQMGICPNCGTQLTDDNRAPAQSVTVPKAVGSERVPRGQEVITVVGGLELDVPIWANHQTEYPYLRWSLEVPRAKLKASYPWVAEKLSGSGMDGATSADDTYARVSRISVKESLPQPVPSDMLYDLVTFDRTWLRTWTFFSVRDADTRNKLLELFPDGCYVAFAGGIYCESRNERMDDHWVVRHAMPGEGQNRPGVGDSLIDIQDRVNTYDNIQAETYEYGIPPIYADPSVLDFDALSNQTAEPGAHYPAKAKSGQSVGNSFWQPAAAEPPQDMVAYKNSLMGEISQMLTGMYPALFGGDTGSNDTATGMTLQRDQAMGRIGLIWRAFKEAWAKANELAVNEFKKNRTRDVQVASKDPSKKPHTVSLSDLKGDIKCFGEADSSYPRLKSQQRASVERLMGMGANAPEIVPIFMEPANQAYLKSLEGLEDLVIPGEDSRNKQLKEIEVMLGQQPIESQGMNPLTGAPTLEPQSSVMIEPLDRDNFEYEECVRWASSDAGIEAQEQNPAGYQNVILHAMAHQKAMQEKGMAANPMPPMPMGKAGAPTPPSAPPGTPAPVNA